MILLCFGLFLAAIIGCLVCGYSLVWALLFGFSLFFCLVCPLICFIPSSAMSLRPLYQENPVIVVLSAP